MGWNAFIIFDDITSDKKELIINDFNKSSIEIKNTGNYVDGYLHIGGLDCKESGSILEQATRMSVYVVNWKKEMVKKIFDDSDWCFNNKVDNGLLLSAMKFLELAAKYNLGIKFSW